MVAEMKKASCSFVATSAISSAIQVRTSGTLFSIPPSASSVGHTGTYQRDSRRSTPRAHSSDVAPLPTNRQTVSPTATHQPPNARCGKRNGTPGSSVLSAVIPATPDVNAQVWTMEVLVKANSETKVPKSQRKAKRKGRILLMCVGCVCVEWSGERVCVGCGGGRKWGQMLCCANVCKPAHPFNTHDADPPPLTHTHTPTHTRARARTHTHARAHTHAHTHTHSHARTAIFCPDL
jgi:hypothetical protein